MRRSFIKLSLLVLFFVASSGLLAKGVDLDINKYKFLLPEKLSGWESEKIDTKMLSGANPEILTRVYIKKDGKILEAQITANYILRSTVYGGATFDINTVPKANRYIFKGLTGVVKKEDGELELSFLLEKQQLLFKITMLDQNEEVRRKQGIEEIEKLLSVIDFSTLKR